MDTGAGREREVTIQELGLLTLAMEVSLEPANSSSPRKLTVSSSIVTMTQTLFGVLPCSVTVAWGPHLYSHLFSVSPLPLAWSSHSLRPSADVILLGYEAFILFQPHLIQSLPLMLFFFAVFYSYYWP